MLKSIKGFLGGNEKKEYTDEEHEEFHLTKQKHLENILGEMHNLVGHAIFPFEIGGAVDMYYFPNGIPGTAFATMELINLGEPNPKKTESVHTNLLHSQSTASQTKKKKTHHLTPLKDVSAAHLHA